MAMTTTHAIKTTAVMTVRRSRFFSHMPDPAAELYKDEAIMSETPVPLPECMSTKTMVSAPDKNRSTSKIMLSAFTKLSFWGRGPATQSFLRVTLVG